MATLFNMYADTPQVDISGTLTQLRREEKDRTDANWKGSKDLLRGAAVASIRKDFKNGISWDDGVKSADESFKRQYERMMVADPVAAQQLREDYMEERTKRVNAEIANAYKSRASGVSGDIQALEQEIMRLESEIQGEELGIKQAAESAALDTEVNTPLATAQGEEAASVIMAQGEAESGLNPSIDTGRLAQPIDRTLEPSASQSDRSRLGEVPVPQGMSLAGLYDINPSLDLGRPLATPQAPQNALQNALPEPRSGMQTQQESTEASRMKGYRPLTAWYGGMK